MSLNKLREEINQKELELKELKIEYNDLVKYPQKNILLKYYQEKLPNSISINTKLGFINFCLEYLEDIRKKNLPEINNEKKQVNLVLIEFREQPHIEFILRNNILKLGNKVNYTVVCGNRNFEMIKKFGISNLNIIIKNVDNLLRGEYSLMLASKEFWEQFDNEYILINQSDSIVFNSNIEDYLGYAYIGSPWLKPTRKRQFFMGNGGFSLRNREVMRDICINFDIKKMPLKLQPVKFMIEDDKKICPEDVYFCQYLLKCGKAILPDFDTCVNFSIESFKSNKPFGGHNFFIHNWKCYFKEYVREKEEKQFVIDNNMEGDIKVVKIPTVNEFLVIKNKEIYESKYLNSTRAKAYKTSYRKDKININNKRNKVHFDKVLLYNNRYDFNWRHFLTETFFSLKDGYNNKDVTILITKNCCKHIYDILTILNIKNYYEVDNRTLVSSNKIVLPSKNRELRDIFLNDFISQCKKIALMNNKVAKQNIFLTRKNNNKNYRYVSNQDKLDMKLKEQKYFFFEGGTVPLYEQIFLINNARKIVTQIGANCDNIIFCNRRCRFKIIYAYNCKKWAQMYADYKQCELLYCGNNYKDNGDKDKYNWNYEIDFSKLKL